jgi:hypothetical protein
MADSRTNTRLTPTFTPPDPNLLAIVRLYLERYEILSEDDRRTIGQIVRMTANPPMMVAGCTQAQSRFDTRTRVLHIVQDIGRPHDMGSADCEQWADMLMEAIDGR